MTDWSATVAMITTIPVVLILFTGMALAARGGHGTHNLTTTGQCQVEGTQVNATGLPTDQLVNFMVSDPSGMTGWVLGFTDDGSWSVTVPASAGSTTYEFASRTWGPNGSKYTVFA
ncbi:MAG TPA: hypothetical protein VFW27_11710, partial [Actinoplanes sp.]|nr:hypothetical protein [Actinoplanes sp.]